MTKFTKANWMTRSLQEKLNIVGEQFRLARLQKGEPTVSLGVVMRVLNALQLEEDILHLAKDDKLGHMVQDLGIKNKKRASKR